MLPLKKLSLKNVCGAFWRISEHEIKRKNRRCPHSFHKTSFTNVNCYRINNYFMFKIHMKLYKKNMSTLYHCTIHYQRSYAHNEHITSLVVYSATYSPIRLLRDSQNK